MISLTRFYESYKRKRKNSFDEKELLLNDNKINVKIKKTNSIIIVYLLIGFTILFYVSILYFFSSDDDNSGDSLKSDILDHSLESILLEGKIF